ncbi:PREDICTED: auxin-induced protein 22E-like [Lupinus angustifolius]|uniref:auxin-induced protein 22E-like n=1 Tax=Lupinus angustifolius TaxID=3871 RepID=UPI00092EDB63|nr:PREDICTED: auxin-induced protein 22E-like [Lupinus angustifolius]
MENVKDTELRLGLPGSDVVRSNKRCCPVQESILSNDSDSTTTTSHDHQQHSVQPSKVQVVGWPPIRSFRKNNRQEKKGDGGGIYVKVTMAGAPYLRKIDLKVYNSYSQLLNALEILFNCTFGEYSEREGYSGSEYVPSYEDKDGDWMLVGDVPWDMFMSSCKRLRIMKGSEEKGLGCL